MPNKRYDNVQLTVTFGDTLKVRDQNISSGENIAKSLGKISTWYNSLVPTGGSSGKILVWNSSGTAKWNDPLHPTITKSTDTTSTATPGHGETFTVVDSITREANGHVTKINTKTVTLPADSNTDTLVSQTFATADHNRPLLMSYYDTGVQTTTAQIVHRNDALFFNPSSGILRSPRLYLQTPDMPITINLHTLQPAAGENVNLMSVRYKNTDGTATHTVFPIGILGNSATGSGATNNSGVRLGSTNGTTIVGAGESSVNFAAAQSKYNDESLYLVTDQSVYMYTNCSNDATTVTGPWRVGGFTTGTSAIASGRVMITDGTTGGFKASDYTIAKSVPSDAKFSDTTYTLGTSGNNVTLTTSSGSVQSITVPYASNAATATSWATTRTLTLSGQLTGSVSVKGDANMTLSGWLKKSLIYDETSDFASYAWHKFAEKTITNAHEDQTITFIVSKTWGDVPRCSGILTAHIRTGATKVYESSQFYWQLANIEINPEDFVFVYTNTADTSCKVELWYKQTGRYDGWIFTVLKEHSRTSNNNVWTLYTSAGHGSASHTTGTASYASSIAGIKNNTSGTSSNVTGTVDIAHGGTGATDRLGALRALTNENVGTSAQYFLTITDNWSNGGFTTVANAKTVLGLKSAAYTASTDYLSSSTKYAASSSVGGPALSVSTAGGDVVLGTSGSSSDDSGDIVWKYGNGQEKARLYLSNTYTAKEGPLYRIFKSDGTGLYSGRLPLADGTSASGTWGISITGNAASADAVYVAVTNGSTTSTNYGIVFAASPNTSEVNTLRKTNDFRYQMKDSAANTEGFATIVLGNTKKLSEANNKSGNIFLYSSGGAWHLINTTSTTSNITHTLPATSGTILNSGTTSFTQNLSSGTKIGTIKINGIPTDLYCETNTNTDTKVTQTNTTTSADYRVLLSGNANDKTETTTGCKSVNLRFNPSSGGLYSFGFLRTDITGQTLDINTLNLSSGTLHSRRFIEKTDAGAGNITNIPVTGRPFLLEVDLIRWASTTDYITRQRFTNAANGAYSYVRYCTNGTWGSWTTRKYTDTDTKVTSSANHYTPATVSGQDKSASASGATAAWSIDVVKGVTLNTDGKGHVTGLSVTSGRIHDNPVPSNNVTGSGTSGYLTKWNGAHTITNGPQLGSSTTTYLRNDGSWATPTNTNTTYTIGTSGDNVTLTPSSGSVQSITVPYATTATQDGDGNTISSTYLRARSTVSTDGGATGWSQIGINQYSDAYPDGVTDKIYGWGAVVSMPAPNARFDLYYNHNSSTAGATTNGLQYRTGWNNDKKAWRMLLDSGNYTSYTVTKTGSGASGTWGISITGNASTSTKATQDGDGKTISSTYLKLSGGTMTGIIKKNAPTSGAWIKARDNALVYANADAKTGSVFCVFGGAKSKTGFWGVGTDPENDSLYFSWSLDTNYANNTNTTSNFSISSAGAFSGTASAWTTARTLTLSGAVTGSASIKGDTTISLVTTVNHTHNYAGSSSAGGPATNVAIARVTKDSKVFPGANKVVFEEYTNGTTYNLPSDHFYHIMSAQGNDTKYGTQLALGMTTTAAYYRVCNNQKWSDWKSLINTNTTYSANNGVGLSGTTFYNSGVRTVSTGSANGTISVNTNGTTGDVPVKGLGTAAYKASSDFAVSQTLANDANLNNITTPGFYNVGGSNSVTNKPSNVDAFGLNVIHDASGQWYTQILYPNNASPLIYVRNYNTSAWSGWSRIAIGSFLPLSGGTMTGTLTAEASQTTAYGGALNMNNSNIYGVNAIYTADVANNAAEGIHFYRDDTHVDTLWMNGGSLLFVPNRELGVSTTVANSQKVARFTANPTTGQVVITDGTTGGIKSSGYTIAKSVPSNAVFTDTNTTYTIATGDSNGQIKVTPSSGSAYNVSFKGADSVAYTVSITSITTAVALRKYTCTANTNTYKTFMVKFTYDASSVVQWFTVTGTASSYYPIFDSSGTVDGVLTIQCPLATSATITFTFNSAAQSHSPEVVKVIGFNFG